MYGYIYRTTNTVNGKTYVGQHKSSSFDRSYLGSGRLLKLAISKYGRRSFTVEVLQWCETKEELDSAEIEQIKSHRERGLAEYNIAPGGGGLVMCGKDNPFFGRKHSEETKRHLSRLASLRRGENSPLFGIPKSPEHVAKTRRTGSTQSTETRRKIGESCSKERECHLCGERIRGMRALKAHRDSAHPGWVKDALLERNQEVFSCSYCGRSVKSRGNLTQHERRCQSLQRPRP